jgi:hypothetical protein
MSRWTHSICDSCWETKYSEKDRYGNLKKGPVRVNAGPDGVRSTDECCFCGAYHHSGIYVRENWAFTRCRGEHIPQDNKINETALESST